VLDGAIVDFPVPPFTVVGGKEAAVIGINEEMLEENGIEHGGLDEAFEAFFCSTQSLSDIKIMVRKDRGLLNNPVVNEWFYNMKTLPRRASLRIPQVEGEVLLIKTHMDMLRRELLRMFYPRVMNWVGGLISHRLCQAYQVVTRIFRYEKDAVKIADEIESVLGSRYSNFRRFILIGGNLTQCVSQTFRGICRAQKKNNYSNVEIIIPESATVDWVANLRFGKRPFVKMYRMLLWEFGLSYAIILDGKVQYYRLFGDDAEPRVVIRLFGSRDDVTNLLALEQYRAGGRPSREDEELAAVTGGNPEADLVGAPGGGATLISILVGVLVQAGGLLWKAFLGLLALAAFPMMAKQDEFKIGSARTIVGKGKPSDKYYRKALEVFGPGAARSVDDFDPQLQKEWEEKRWNIIEMFFRLDEGADYDDEGRLSELMEQTILVAGTDNCDLNCVFCISDASSRKRTFTDPEALKRFLVDLETETQITPLIGLTGGEVTYNKKFFLHLLDKVGGYVKNISTNGSFASSVDNTSEYLEAILARLGERFVNFTLPLDDEHSDSASGRREEKVANFIRACDRISLSRRGGARTRISIVSRRGDDSSNERKTRRKLSAALGENIRFRDLQRTGLSSDQEWVLARSRYRLHAQFYPIFFHGRAFLQLGNKHYKAAPYSEADLETINSETDILESPSNSLCISPNGVVVPLEAMDIDPRPLRLTDISRENAVEDLRRHIVYDPLVDSLYDISALSKLI